MKRYFEMYLSEEFQGKEDEILRGIEENKVQINKYVIVLSKNEMNHLEFFDAALLRQEIFDKDSLFVVGIGNGYGEAVKLVQKITEEVLCKTGGTDIRGFLLGRQKEFEERRL